MCCKIVSCPISLYFRAGELFYFSRYFHKESSLTLSCQGFLSINSENLFLRASGNRCLRRRLPSYFAKFLMNLSRPDPVLWSPTRKCQHRYPRGSGYWPDQRRKFSRNWSWVRNSLRRAFSCLIPLQIPSMIPRVSRMEIRFPVPFPPVLTRYAAPLFSIFLQALRHIWLGASSRNAWPKHAEGRVGSGNSPLSSCKFCIKSDEVVLESPLVSE